MYVAVVTNIVCVPAVWVTGTARLVRKWLENVGEIGFVGGRFEVMSGGFEVMTRGIEAMDGGTGCCWYFSWHLR
jgi:hypothetical protein